LRNRDLKSALKRIFQHRSLVSDRWVKTDNRN
jgi:hypothetical protein